MIDDLPEEPVVVNLNVPNVGVNEIKGWRHARVGHEPGRKMASATLESIEGREGAFSVRTEWGDPITLPADTDVGVVDNDEVALTYLSRLAAEQRTDLGAPEGALTSLLAR
jgi:5'-nucleotidase